MKRLRLGNKKWYKIDLLVLGPLSLQLAVKNGKGCQGQFFRLSPLSPLMIVTDGERRGGGGRRCQILPEGFFCFGANVTLR